SCPSPKTDPTGSPSIRALANEMNQVKGRDKIVADNHVTQRYVPAHPAARFPRTARYRCGKVGLSSGCIFGEPQVECWQHDHDQPSCNCGEAWTAISGLAASRGSNER